MLTPYPTELPTADAWRLMEQLIAGGAPTPDPHALHVGWDCAGYALGHFDPDPTVSAMDPRAAISLLASGKKAGIADWPWLQIATLILQTLLQLIPVISPKV